MNVDVVLKRFFNQWQQFALVGVGAFLVQMGAGVLATLLTIVVAGPALIMGFLSPMSSDFGFSGGGLLGMIAAFAGLFLGLIVIGVIASGMSFAGMVGSVAGHRRGEEVTLGGFWVHAKAHFGKLILLSILLTLTMMLSMILVLIPILGWIALLIWGPMAFIHLFIYPAYLIVTQSMGVTEAYGVGFRVITSQFGEAVVASLIFLLISLCIWIIAFIPILGAVAAVIFVEPFIIYFFTERFESNVRPKLGL